MERPPLEASPSPSVWREAEERVEEMLYVFQPTVVSQDTRNEVIEYVQTMIGSYIEAEVSFPFPFNTNNITLLTLHTPSHKRYYLVSSFLLVRCH